jgi:hypothetical protein
MASATQPDFWHPTPTADVQDAQAALIDSDRLREDAPYLAEWERVETGPQEVEEAALFPPGMAQPVVHIVVERHIGPAFVEHVANATMSSYRLFDLGRAT